MAEALLPLPPPPAVVLPLSAFFAWNRTLLAPFACQRSLKVPLPGVSNCCWRVSGPTAVGPEVRERAHCGRYASRTAKRMNVQQIRERRTGSSVMLAWSAALVNSSHCRMWSTADDWIRVNLVQIERRLVLSVLMLIEVLGPIRQLL